MRKTIVLIMSCVLLIAGAASADTIYLKNGKKIKGDIYEDLGYAVKVKVKGSLKTYFEREIERIERSKPKEKASPGDTPVEKRNLDKIEESKKELIRRFLAANGARDSMMDIFTKLVATLSKKDQARVKDVIVADKLIEAITPVYDRHFSKEELKELITFYSSPAGKKIVKLMPTVLEESLEAALMYFRAELGGGKK